MSSKPFFPNRFGFNLILPVFLALLVAVVFGALTGVGSPLLQAGVLLVPIVFLGLLLGIRRPETLLFALIGLYYLLGVLESNIIPETYLFIGVGVILTASMVLRWVVHKEKPVGHPPSAILGILFGIWATISALDSPQFGLVRIYWLVVILFLLVPNLIQSPQQWVWFAWVITLSAAAASVVVLWQQVSLFGLSGLLDVRTVYLGTNRETAMDSGGLISTRLSKGLPFAVALLFFERSRPVSRGLLIVSIGFILLVGILTFSSNGLIGIFLTFFLLALLLSRRRDKYLLMILMVVGLMIVFRFSLAQRLVEQIQLIIAGEDFLKWGSSRGLKYYLAWQSIRHSPIFGHGPGQAGNVLPSFLPLEYVRVLVKDFTVPHNMLLSIWVDIGLPGLILFLGLYSSVVLRLWNAVRLVDPVLHKLYQMIGYAILIALVIFFIQGMFISIQLDKLVWILMGAAVGFSLSVDRGTFSKSASGIQSQLQSRHVSDDN